MPQGLQTHGKRVAHRNSTHFYALENTFRFIDGMTILLRGHGFLGDDLAGTTELSSRPERSGVEGSAVSSLGSHTLVGSTLLRVGVGQYPQLPVDTRPILAHDVANELPTLIG